MLYREEYVENPEGSKSEISQIKYLFIVEGGRAHMRRVSLGHESGTVLEISQGVKKGEQVVVRGLHKLNDGDRIKVVKGEGSGT